MDTQLSPANALRTRNTYMSYLSGVGYAAMWSCQDLPSPLEYASREKKVATRLCSCQDLPSHLEYVSREKSGYAATQLSRPPLFLGIC